MRAATVVMFSFALAIQASAECLAYTEASKNIGTTHCVCGKVLKVTRSNSGTYFLNFCPDYRGCAFQVVVFPADLRHVGDIRQLEGKVIEIQGDIKECDGRPEIVLKDSRQSRGEAARIPPCQKTSTSKTKAAIVPAK
jgi:hypothetical protein